MVAHTGSTANPFLFNAQQFDGASGDYYLRARYYDQSSGRFISQDPYSGNDYDPISLHRYLYANSSPVNYTDPSGELSEGEVTFASTETQALQTIAYGLPLLALSRVLEQFPNLYQAANAAEATRLRKKVGGSIALYHYTSPDGLQGILFDHAIRPDLQEGPRAAYGHGQYFTDLPPTGLLTKPEHTSALFRQPFGRQQQKTESWLLIDLTVFPVRRVGGIYLDRIDTIRAASVANCGVFLLPNEVLLPLTLPGETPIPGSAQVLAFGSTIYYR